MESSIKLIDKKEHTTDTHNMDESKNVYSKCKEPDTKEYTLCDSISMEF